MSPDQEKASGAGNAPLANGQPLNGPAPIVGNQQWLGSDFSRPPQAGATPSQYAGGTYPGISAPAAAQPDTLTCMRTAKRWLLWNRDKVPFYANGNARGGILDSAEDRAALATFEDAQSVLVASGGRFAGVGFALGQDEFGGHWQGIDLDDVRKNGLAHLANAVPGYVEFSPSGEGIHAIGYGRQFSTLGSNGSGVEAYAGGRYFTVTGKCIRASTLLCLAEFVEQVVAPAHGASRTSSSSKQVVEVVSVDAKTVSEIRSALMHMRSDDYHLWIRMGHALRELGDVGRGLWLGWSATSDKFQPKDARKWDTFNPQGTGYQAVFAEAQKQGWVNPASNAARLVAANGGDQMGGEDLLNELHVNWSSTDDVDVPDIITGLVADEEVTLLGGHGGIGKSFLTLQMACAVATGEPVLSHGTRQQRVLYYSAEDGRKRLTRRLRKMVEHFHYDPDLLARNLVVVDASELDPLFGESSESVDGKRSNRLIGATKGFEKLQRMVEVFDPQLLVVDGASDTFDGNEIVRREVRAFIRLLRRVHPNRSIGVLLTVHIDRSSARGHSSNDDGYAGSAQWHNSCRRRLYLQLKKEKDDDGNEMGESIFLKVMKNQDGPPEPDMELQRGLHGMWQLGVHFAGELTKADSPDHSAVLLELIDSYCSRGIHISTSLAPQAQGVYAVLHGDPNFPKDLTKKRTTDLVRRLEREGRLVKSEYKRKNRSVTECWRVAHDAGN